MKNLILFVLIFSTLLCAQFSSNIDYNQKDKEEQTKSTDFAAGELLLDLGQVEWNINYQKEDSLSTVIDKYNYAAKSETTIGGFKLHYQKSFTDIISKTTLGYTFYSTESSYYTTDLLPTVDTLKEAYSFEEDLAVVDFGLLLEKDSVNYGIKIDGSYLLFDEKNGEEESFSSFFLSVNPFYIYELKNKDELKFNFTYAYLDTKIKDFAERINFYYKFPAQTSFGLSYKLNLENLYYKLSYNYFHFEDYIYEEDDDNSNFDLEAAYKFDDLNINLQANIGINISSDFASLEKPLPLYYYSFVMSNRFLDNQMALTFKWDYSYTDLKLNHNYYLKNEDFSGNYESEYITNKINLIIKYFL